MPKGHYKRVGNKKSLRASLKSHWRDGGNRQFLFAKRIKEAGVTDYNIIRYVEKPIHV